jgi:hypothetical protein
MGKSHSARGSADCSIGFRRSFSSSLPDSGLSTAGLAVSSLRNWPRQQSGWWTDLFSIETWTLDGYRAAMSVSADNSFAIAVPATLLLSLFV